MIRFLSDKLNHKWFYGSVLPKPLPPPQALLPSSSTMATAAGITPAIIQVPRLNVAPAARLSNSTSASTAVNTTSGNTSEDMPNHEPGTTGNNQIIITSNSSETTGNMATTDSEIPDNKSTPDNNPDENTVDSNKVVSVISPETDTPLNLDTPIGVGHVDKSYKS